ncbi:9627_t:CDS:1, partial [Acaulospora colombiana]
ESRKDNGQIRHMRDEQGDAEGRPRNEKRVDCAVCRRIVQVV